MRIVLQLSLFLCQQIIFDRIVEGNTLDVTEVRLAEGSGLFEGRVEIKVDGVWGTVCDEDFDFDDASAICRTINPRLSAILTERYYGPGYGPVFVQEFKCSGFETHIRQCSYESNVFCTHSKDVGLICSECGIVSVQNGQAGSISTDGTIITITCDEGYQNDSSTSICVNGAWSPSSITCSQYDFPLDITRTRLVNGVGLADGRVEILVNDTWGTLCGKNIHKEAADVICFMLGFSDAQDYNYHYYGEGLGPVYLSNLECTGTERHINNCTYDIIHSCTHNYDLAVVCRHLLNITDIRLVDGTGEYDGRVEVLSNDMWGTICNKYLNFEDLQTVCRMLNLNYTHQFATPFYEQRDYPILIGALGCRGDKTTLNKCLYSPPSKNHCNHDHDLTLVCTDCGEIDDAYGTVYSNNGSVITVKCNPGYQPVTYTMQCLRNGTWIQHQSCSLMFDYPLDISDIRLVNLDTPSIPSEGLVEISVNGTWGTICTNYMNADSANVICHMLGLEIKSFYTQNITNGQSSGPILIENLNCTGTETHINECTYDLGNSCTHTDDLAVECTGYQLIITDIRLAGTSGPYHGRVEIKVNETWGTVGDNFFRTPEAQVVCRMLGLEYKSYHLNAYYGQGSGPVLIDRLNCDPSASHINECRYSVNNYYNTQHNDDVSVTCWGPSLSITEARLVNGTGKHDGRVEIKVNSTWGTICDRNFDIYSADLICNMFGLRAVQYFTRALYGEGTGPIYIDELYCDESDKDLSTCMYLYFNECTHDRDVSVVCNECGQPGINNYWDVGSYNYQRSILYIDCTYYRTYVGIFQLRCDNNTQTWIKEGECQEYSFPLNITDVRLVDGTSITSGRVEIKSLDTWGTVCGNSFGVAEANVICHMIGYPYAVEFYISAYHGEGTGPIFVDELSCGENGTHINNCTYITYDDCTHENDVSVVCLECENVTITNGFMTATDYNAVIKIECDSSFKLIGDSVITCQLNGLWSDIPTCSPIDCGYPTVPYADISISNNRTTLGETIIVNCWPGYKINGNSSIECGFSGQWENISTCSPVDCGNISAPINGHVNDFQGTKFNAMIRFSCNAGYVLVGAENIKCEENGTWTNESPICVIKSGIGGSCINHEYCLLEGSQCVNNVCICSSGIYDKLGNKCDTMPLMPFGADEGDYVIPDSSTCGPKIEFQPGFPIRNKLHTKLFVCRFGYISFDKVFENPTPPKSALSIDQNEMLLAPFYGPIDKQKSGPVTYKTYDILNSYNEMKEKKELISTIEMFVKRFGNLDWFHASFILIATWNKTVTIIPGFDSTKTSTFQIILVSGGKFTFSFFIYGNGMMNWKYNLSMAPPVWIGSSLHSLTYTQPYAFTNKALQLDILSSVTVEDTEVSGLVFRELNAADTAYINPGVDCIRWYNENYEDKKHINYMANLMPECPCDITLSRYDPWFWRIGLYRWRYDLTHKCVDMLLIGHDWQHGKTCCYDIRSGLLINERPLAGSFQLYNRNYPNEHFKNDIEPKEKCCASSKYCSLYYELRPTGSCYRKSPYSFGSFWGVSHFSTLDGLNYTFNGLGEYTLLRIRTGNCSFDLQARKERAVKSNDNFSHASMFTAFAAKDKSSSVHVERNREHTGLNIYGNDVDLTKQYNDNTDEMEPFIWSSTDYLLTVSKHNESVNAYFSSCDISLSISLTTEMLILQTFVQSSFKNLTQGLLGNYNDDSSDDFITPNGSVLMSNLTEQEIFEYGQTWAIDPSNSAFKYDAGKDHFDFHNDSYVPRFLDDIDEHLKEKALEVCDSSTNIECIFDFAFTENAKIAKENNRIKEKLNEDKMEIDEDVPLLEGCSTLNIIRGQKSTCKLTITNGDSFHIVSKNINAEINQEESTVSFLPESNEPISIRIEAMNKNGRRSPQFALDIIMCTGCSNHGVCTSSLRTDLRENEYFRYHSCKCDLGYDGIDCENSFDGCAGSPCSLDRNCTKLQAEEQQAINKSYICDPCPDGYLDDNDDCIDQDECKVNNGGCSQHCSNTDGSFQCSCDDGYRLSIDDLYTCIDIDECEELLHNCSHLCTNTEGGFTCQCFSGYELNRTSCVQISDGICSVTKQNDCRSADGCTVNGEVEECFCVNGYELDETGTKCLDINECGRHICSQGCLNTHGNYECYCFAGYRLEDTSTCKECENTFWGNDCEQECLCSGRGADKCHPVKGCICESGWFGESCNEDINECEFDIPPCSNPRTECVNTLGSYSCKCRVGFSLSNKGICTDIDECKEPHLNNCTQECINTIGSFSCECKNGFTRKDQTSCDDINECELGIFDCEQKCVNNRGQYSCYCHYGYTLNDDRRTCSKIEDPCLSINNLTCSHFCELVDHNAVCGCQNGFIIQNDNQTCTDVNECKNTEKNECEDNSTCFNSEGSYLCNCPIGKRLENDGRTCTDCDQYHYGRNCAHNCSCLKGKCDMKTGCICDPGWAGDRCETDIDECFTGQVTCQVLHSTCINLPGTAFCLCDVGYQNISGVCEDINECSDVSLNDCDQLCTNTEGSYSCSCQRGFAFDDASCKDTDECAGSHDCDQGCTNTIGSYRCFCKEGFRLDLTNRESCIALQECNEKLNSTCPKDSVCFVKDDDVHCRCLKGFKEIDNTCTDIDECQEYNPCSHKCLNTLGRYNCSCNDGFILRPDKRTCKACDNWQYGHDCGKPCSCNKSFTESCNGETGECRCRSGMIGSTCDIDVDECSNKSFCPNNSYCVNTLGSFTCKCHEGYFKTGINSCDECDFRHFGKHCLNDCQCKFENTKDCNHVTGACTCTQEWEGDTCMDDLNECLNNTNVCMNKEWSTCTNKNGSFTCDCNIGFMEYDNRCQDVNECRNNQNICNKNTVCVNIFGSYVCDCKRGFVMSSMGECIEDKTEGIKKPDSGIWIEAVAVIEIELPEETNLNAASIYLNIQMKLIDMLRIYFKKFTESVLHFTINDIKKGSLTTNFTATYDTAENNFTSQLVAGILQLGNGAQLLYDGQLVNVSSDTFDGQLPCMIFYVIGGSCGDRYACILEDGIPVCSFQNEPQDGNSQLVTGLAVTGSLILLGLALLILYILILRKRTQRKKLSSQRRFMTDTVTEGEYDGGSEFYRNSKWQDGKVVYTGIRDGTNFMLPRYIPTYLNFPIQSPFASSTARSRNDDLIAS